MKLVLALLLFTNVAFCQVKNFNAVPTSVQRGIDSVQNAQLTAMSAMSKTLQTADSAKCVMLGKLSTDTYVTLPGNVTGLLGIANKQQVRNTINSNLHEIWVGTPDGNRLLTMRGSIYSTTLSTGQQVIAIPHGLGYQPVVFSAHIFNQANATYTLTAMSTYIILTLPSLLVTSTAYTVSWLAR